MCADGGGEGGGGHIWLSNPEGREEETQSAGNSWMCGGARAAGTCGIFGVFFFLYSKVIIFFFKGARGGSEYPDFSLHVFTFSPSHDHIWMRRDYILWRRVPPTADTKLCTRFELQIISC